MAVWFFAEGVDPSRSSMPGSLVQPDCLAADCPAMRPKNVASPIDIPEL